MTTQPLDLSKLDYRRFLECVHCGLCTAACPTYLETGDENDSPRGRIHLMKAVADGRLEPGPAVQRHLDLCLDCRSCETACPSGVQYGHLIETFRIAQEKVRDRSVPDRLLRNGMLAGIFPYKDLVRPALWAARLSQFFGVPQMLERTGLDKWLPYALRKMMGLLPAPGTWQTAPEIPEVVPAVGTRRARVAFFTGCAASVMYPATNWNTVQVLARNGIEVVTPRGQVCCGAVHYHSGQEDPAREFARTNVSTFGSSEVGPIDAVLTNCGGCGHMLHHVGDLLKDDPFHAKDADAFAHKVQDVAEFLLELGPVPFEREINAVATYHDSCHLSHGMGVRGEPRALLARIPGLKLRPLRESDICCGAAGVYNVVEQDMSERLSKRKLDNIRDTGAGLVIAGNVVCLMQITQAVRESGTKAQVEHTFDVLARAYGIA